MHKLYAKILFLISGITLTAVAFGIIGFFPNPPQLTPTCQVPFALCIQNQTYINPMNLLILLLSFLVGLFVWFFGGHLEGEED